MEVLFTSINNLKTYCFSKISLFISPRAMEKQETPKPKKQTVYSRYCNGPHGLGEPDDLFLRKVEMDVMIPKKMRDRARVEKCFQEVEDFTECCKATGLLMVMKCRKENTSLKACLTKWYNDEQFKEECKQIYLDERSEYRRTGVPLKERQRIGSSM